MTKKFLTATALACALIAPTAASAAKIEFKPCNTSVKGCYAIMIDGDILEGDGEKFVKEATEKNVTTGIVNLNSYGGHLQSGLMIGLEIKERKLQTFVGDEWTCVSVCADMWLAGSIRYYGGAKTRIGFHGAYWLAVDKNGKPAKGAKPQVTSSGNAVMGAYLGGLGLSYDAIATLTKAGPDKAFWLTVDSAQKLGIEVKKWQEPPKVTPGVQAPTNANRA